MLFWHLDSIVASIYPLESNQKKLPLIQVMAWCRREPLAERTMIPRHVASLLWVVVIIYWAFQRHCRGKTKPFLTLWSSPVRRNHMADDLSSYIASCVEIDLTHWGRVTHICVSKLTLIGSDNGLSPDRRQAIIWTNVGILSIESSGTNISKILKNKIRAFSFKKMHLKMSSGKWRPSCLGLNVLIGVVHHKICFKATKYFMVAKN